MGIGRLSGAVEEDIDTPAIERKRTPKSIGESTEHPHEDRDTQDVWTCIVVSAAKSNMINNMTIYQIDSKPGHRVQEHIFVIKSVMGLCELQNKAIIINLYDLAKFFDRENLRDCLGEVYRNNVKGKLYRLLFLMNKSSGIRVKTPVGISEERRTGECVGQGSLDGALVSAVNIDNGVNDFFHDSHREIYYANVRVQPLLYQDDVLRVAEDVVSAQCGNDKMEMMAETK